jgi:glycosyltransferase 2 family protein
MRWFKRLVLVATAVGLGLAVWKWRDAVSHVDWRTLPWAALLLALPPLVQACAFVLVLRLLGGRAPLLPTVLVWMRSFLARYAPSGAAGVVMRSREGERLGASATQLWAATAYEQLIALVAGAAVCVAAFLVARTPVPWPAALVLGAAVAVAVGLRPRFSERWVRRVLRRRTDDLPRLLRGREIALAVAVAAVGWIPTAAAVHLLAGSGYASGLGAYAFAWLVGFLVPLAPGGLGLRDGLVAASLGPAAAVVLRIASTLGEVIAFVVVEVVHVLSRLGSRPPMRTA